MIGIGLNDCPFHRGIRFHSGHLGLIQIGGSDDFCSTLGWDSEWDSLMPNCRDWRRSFRFPFQAQKFCNQTCSNITLKFTHAFFTYGRTVWTRFLLPRITQNQVRALHLIFQIGLVNQTANTSWKLEPANMELHASIITQKRGEIKLLWALLDPSDFL